MPEAHVGITGKSSLDHGVLNSQGASSMLSFDGICGCVPCREPAKQVCMRACAPHLAFLWVCACLIAYKLEVEVSAPISGIIGFSRAESLVEVRMETFSKLHGMCLEKSVIFRINIKHGSW